MSKAKSSLLTFLVELNNKSSKLSMMVARPNLLVADSYLDNLIIDLGCSLIGVVRYIELNLLINLELEESS